MNIIPFSARKIRIERKFPRRAVMMLADADKLRQVFWNICDNSLKAMPDGGTLTVQAEEVGKRVRVVLADTGIGFTSVQLEKVFEPFQSGFNVGDGFGIGVGLPDYPGTSGLHPGGFPAGKRGAIRD